MKTPLSAFRPARTRWLTIHRQRFRMAIGQQKDSISVIFCGADTEMPSTQKLRLIAWAWESPYEHAFPEAGFRPLLARMQSPAVNSGVLDLVEWLKYRTLDGVVYEDTRVHPAEPPELMCEIHVVPSTRRSVFLGVAYDARAMPDALATCYLMGLWSASDGVNTADFVAAAKAALVSAQLKEGH
ncbi:hypothetical protein ACSFA8_24010 [Variovorax sp. RT4R15]|uniref:hypothetical protein n=1 Tax=Variovorax sp. RT4R15 TaxID=3443737 RepID=UPI003F44D898